MSNIPVYEEENSLPARVAFGIDPPWATDAYGRGAHHIAALVGDYRTLKKVLPICDGAAKGDGGLSLLHAAAKGGSHECVRISMPFGSPEQGDALGKTPAHLVAESGDEKSAILMAEKCDPFVEAADGSTVLRTACRKARTSDFLTPFFVAALARDKVKARSEIPSAVKAAKEEGNSAVLSEAFRRAMSTLNVPGGPGGWLVFAMDDVLSSSSASSLSAWSTEDAMGWAVRFDDEELLDATLRAEGNPRREVFGGMCSLLLAAKLGKENAIAKMMRHIPSDDTFVRNLFLTAASSGNAKVLDILSERLEPDTFGRDGMTAFHLAALNGDGVALKILMAYCNPIRKDRKGRTVKDLAFESGDETVLVLAEELGASF